MNKTIVNWVLGGPASGKGTFCINLCSNYSSRFKHLSAGDLIRKEINLCSNEKDSAAISNDRLQRSEKIQKIINLGNIIPAEITVELLWEAIKQDRSMVYFIDGFPRDNDNLWTWNKQMSPNCEVKYAFFQDCPEEVMFDRLRARMNIENRSDDRLEIFQNRIDQYNKITSKIQQYYMAEDKAVVINANAPEQELIKQAIELTEINEFMQI